jgi:molybdopterin-dependent oxidoreductase alpha subunit
MSQPASPVVLPAAQTPEGFTGLTVTEPGRSAAGAKAVAVSLAHVFGQAGVARGSHALAVLNQAGGVDCPSCAWPDPDGHRSLAEFCENGAKAIAWEADARRIDAAFWATHSIDDLGRMSDYEHGQLGRLTEPVVLRPGSRHYEPLAWPEAFKLIADELKALPTPDGAAFYTSGRTSNEAAFLYQLFGRKFGTNNFPDCSNMCHESSSVALPATIGIGKGTVKLDDFEKADVILILGQNPGTNHPRMLTALQKAKRAGAVIVAVNPLREAGLLGFRNPQEVRGMLGVPTDLADRYLQVRVGGDLALLRGVVKHLLALDAVDRDFVATRTDGFDAMKAAAEATTWAEVVHGSAIPRREVEALAQLLADKPKVIACWAMGLTQHKHAVATIQELVNVLLLRGSLGKPGAGVCPVRGHSNVQGDRTMGINERVAGWFLDKLGVEFGFDPPRQHGHNVVEAIRAMADGRVKVFVAMGGNFLSATPDTDATAAALSKCRLTAHVSIKLNRSHLVPGRTALILPCLGRTEIDTQAGGPQFVTTENSMGVVQQSVGKLNPASPTLLSECAIVAGIAEATLGPDSGIPWADLVADYDRVRDRVERVVPGFDGYNRRARQPGGFYLPNGPRDGKFPTATGKARFTVNELPDLDLPPGQLAMMTVRTHDQFNTTVYGLDDRYRGLYGERRVALLSKTDLAANGLAAGDVIDLTSHFRGVERVARHFIAVEYDLPAGCCVTYFPETNVLVPLDSVADGSQTPTSKFVPITVKRSAAAVPANRAAGA